MSKRKRLLFSLFLVFLANGILLNQAAGQTVHRLVKWSDPVTLPVKSTTPVKVLHFEGGIYNVNDVPQYVERFPIANAHAHASATVTGVQYEQLKEASLLKNTNGISKDLTIKTEVVVERKKAYVQVSFIPIKKISDNSFDRLTSFDLTVSVQSYGASSRLQTRIYAANSVLSTGTWYKLGVTNDGIYKLSYTDLQNLGISVDAINPQNIRIYGNGGAMLPFANSAPRYDDLQENAIYVQGQNDGKFNTDDYVLFYGQSPNRWSFDSCDNHYHHQVNWYSDTTYYFITTDLGVGKRIQSEASVSAPSNETVTTFDDYLYHEYDAINWLKSGREWYGESFDEFNNAYSFQFNFPNHVDSMYLRSDVWGRSVNTNCHFDVSVNGSALMSQWIPAVPDQVFETYAYPCSTATSCTSGSIMGFLSASDGINVNLKFTPNPMNPQGLGWLNYLEVNAHRILNMPLGTGQLQFRNMASTGAGKIAEYSLSGSNASTQVWDITDQLNVTNVVPENNSAGVFSFRLPADALHQFISFNGTLYYSPSLVGQIANQNLHALTQADMVIVAHPNFMNAALRLAQFHKNNDHFTVQVVTPQQIYNEFSSGKQDVTAIRDFMKMFYDRASTAGTAPQCLLLFGRGSYDPKYRIPGNTNYIVCYESEVSNDPTSSYMSDDFFAFLDDNEGDWEDPSVTNLMDVSVGRLPVRATSDAEAMVDKILHYATPAGALPSGTSCTTGGGSAAGLNDWRNIVAFVADDEDNNIHFDQCESLAQYVDTGYKQYNIDKLYMDSYKQVATPGGDRYPDGEAAIVQRVQRGSLFVDYIGHGGPIGWGEERFLTDDDINSWTNYDRLPAFITATCEFSTADDPSIVSAGELVLLNTKGGGISLFTTCRLAFSAANFDLGQHFFTHIFTPINSRMPRMGDICMLTKNEYLNLYTRNFLLLGDPALTLVYPKLNVTTTTISGSAVTGTSVPDTMKALQKVTVTGIVDDGAGNKLTGFNGVIYPTVYDKATTYHTLANDPTSEVAPFQLQKSALYKGAATVKNGDFTFTFVVPKDIAYQYGYGKLSYYANNASTDASGYFENFIIGGADANAAPDTKGPVIKLYMNDTTFVFGGITNQNPSLYAEIMDSSGVSTVGNGIGHDITVQLDNDNTKIYVLNDYYQADLNSYQSGKVIYAFSGLSEGTHSITFKAWDVYNNSSEARLEFIVTSSSQLTLTHVLNYPNPFTTSTKFFFEHNKPCMPLIVQISIYTISGKLVKTILNDIQCDGFRSNSIEWDGLDDYGDKIGRGVYVYRLKVQAADGSEADKFEKLVVLR